MKHRKLDELLAASLFSVVFFILWKVWGHEVAVWLMLAVIYGRMARRV